MAVGRAAGGIRVADTMRRPQEARTLRTCNRPDDPAEVCDLGLTCRGCKPCTDRSLGERGLIHSNVCFGPLCDSGRTYARTEKCQMRHFSFASELAAPVLRSPRRQSRAASAA